MAAFALEMTDARVFAPKQSLPRGGTTTTRSDVFSARERRPGASTGLEPRRVAITLSIGDIEIVLIYTHFDTGLPQWADPVLRSLATRWGAESGWNGYNAKPTDVRLVVNLLNHLSALMRDHSAPPTMVPLADGGMQAEWHEGGRDLEIVVPFDAPPSFCFSGDDGTDEDGDLELHYARVHDMIARFQ